MNPTRIVLEAAAFRALSGAAGVLPRPALLSLGTLAGRLGWFLDRRHRRITLENLRAALSDAPVEAEIRRVALRCWEHFGRITLDALAFRRLANEGPRGRVIHEGLEHLREAYAGGRGVLEFSWHYGHWELAGLVRPNSAFRSRSSRGRSTTLPVLVVVLQVAELARAVNLSRDVRLLQPGYRLIRQALVNIGFLAAIRRSTSSSHWPS